MTHTSGTTPDSTPALHWRRWRPDAPGSEVRAKLALVHGIHEHSGRYAYVASRLMLRGIEVHAIDLRGHGHSEGARGEIGSFDEYLLDVDLLTQRIAADSPEVPTFLIGHSMGGLIAASWWAARDNSLYSGLILSSAAFALPPVNPVLTALAPQIARFAPRLRVASVDRNALSRDERVWEQYKSDPLVTNAGVKARTAHEILLASQAIHTRMDAFTTPLYIFHGTDDQITMPSGSTTFAETAPANDVTLRLWRGLRHETLNEPERDDVIDAIADWILARA